MSNKLRKNFYLGFFFLIWIVVNVWFIPKVIENPSFENIVGVIVLTIGGIYLILSQAGILKKFEEKKVRLTKS